jgi:hypothetical protein
MRPDQMMVLIGVMATALTFNLVFYIIGLYNCLLITVHFLFFGLIGAYLYET